MESGEQNGNRLAGAENKLAAAGWQAGGRAGWKVNREEEAQTGGHETVTGTRSAAQINVSDATVTCGVGGTTGVAPYVIINV